MTGERDRAKSGFMANRTTAAAMEVQKKSTTSC